VQASATAQHVFADLPLGARDGRLRPASEVSRQMSGPNFLLRRSVSWGSRTGGGLTMAMTKKSKEKRAAERKAARAEKPQSSKASSDSMTAVELLEQDHREVEGYFDDYDELNDDTAKG
jgi:hypothetical protein